MLTLDKETIKALLIDEEGCDLLMSANPPKREVLKAIRELIEEEDRKHPLLTHPYQEIKFGKDLYYGKWHGNNGLVWIGNSVDDYLANNKWDKFYTINIAIPYKIMKGLFNRDHFLIVAETDYNDNYNKRWLTLPF